MKRIMAGVLATSLLVGAGCKDGNTTQTNNQEGNNTMQNNSTDQNLFDILSGYDFVGQDGQPVNKTALAASLRGNHTTLTFGFAKCENYCPMINRVVAELGKNNRELTSIVIAANTEQDGADQTSRDQFMERLRGDGVSHKVVILYPTKEGKLDNSVSPHIAMQAGAISNPERPLDHSAKVILFAPGGKKLKEKSGLRPAKEFVEEWVPEMSAAVGK